MSQTLQSAPPTRAARTALLSAATLTIMAPALLAPSLPAMTDDFGGTDAAGTAARLALTATSLAIAVTAPLAGVAADRWGRRRVLVAGLVLYALAGTAGWFAPTLAVLTGTRALLGVAVGAVTTAVAATVADWFTGERRRTFVGLQQAAASVGGIVFLPLAGVLAGVGWRAPFWLHLAALPVAAAVLATVRTDGRDAPAATSTSPAAADGPGGTPWRARAAGLYALVLVASALFYLAPTQVPFLLDARGAAPAVVGLAVAATTVTSLLGALAFPAVRRRVPAAAVTALGVATLGAGWLVVGWSTGVADVLAGLLVGGVGVGLVVPNLQERLAELAPPAARGRVLAGLVSGIFLGQFVSPLAAAPVLAVTGSAGAFAWAGAGALAAAAVGAATVLTRTARP
ncbi:MFS transporter [Cellulomonas sp. JZ18]|uniref:MFS transporter n=1 Tax=Cellulomonas sp. JZ18 TaxID=2654191 RepID=UPI0012D480FE|nr:MFS transporter [Cellulomonas sp. JZ18]QGQ18492.1 MFS transporter [Cellulomonas sp. JZ18]